MSLIWELRGGESALCTHSSSFPACCRRPHCSPQSSDWSVPPAAGLCCVSAGALELARRSAQRSRPRWLEGRRGGGACVRRDASAAAVCPPLSSISPPGPPPSTTPWSLISGPQRSFIHTFILCPITTFPPADPSPLFPSCPPPPALSRDRSIKGCHGIDELLSGEGRGD